MRNVCFAILGLAGLLAAMPAAWGQQPLHIGYVYPAGGKQGTTFEAIIGGQFLTGASDVHVSGGGVQVKLDRLIQPITGGEINKLRIKIDELLARKAVVEKDFRMLERFRSFKNAKTAKNAKEVCGRPTWLAPTRLPSGGPTRGSLALLAALALLAVLTDLPSARFIARASRRGRRAAAGRAPSRAA